MVDLWFGVGGCSTDQRRPQVLAVEVLQNVGDYLTDVGFRPEGDAMVRDLA
jgi:hypothetical protein